MCQPGQKSKGGGGGYGNFGGGIKKFVEIFFKFANNSRFSQKELKITSSLKYLLNKCFIKVCFKVNFRVRG